MHAEYITIYICYIFLAVEKLPKKEKNISMSVCCNGTRWV